MATDLSPAVNEDTSFRLDMPHTLELAPGVYFARLDRRAVVLDLGRDRYTGLSQKLTDQLVDAFRQTAASPSQGRAPDAELFASELLRPGVQPQASLQAPAPDASLWPRPSPRGAALQWLSNNQVLAQTWISLRNFSFLSSVSWVQRELNRVRSVAQCSPQEILDSFVAVRPWFPAQPICRLEAMALAVVMARAGHDPQLVFGVRLDPFHAHCWVQLNGILLNEAVEDIWRYTPIMTIRGS